MNGYVVFGWFLLLLCLSASAGQAQSTVLYFNEPPKETLGRNRNQLTINRFFTDRDDFLWFVSSNGISRYDGHEIESVHSNPVDLNSLSSAHAVDMIQDEQGNFWITTRDGGLNAYNPQTGKVTHFRHVPTDKASLSSDNLRFLQRDASGQLWIGSDWGMNRFDPKTGRTVRFLPQPGKTGELQGNPLSPIVVTASQIYVSTTAGFEYYDLVGSRWHYLPIDKQGGASSSTGRLNTSGGLCKDHRGLLWMGVPDQTGLRVFNPETGQLTSFTKQTAGGKAIPFPKVMLEDRLGRLWLCCENDIFRISADRAVVEQCTPVAVDNQERLSGLLTLYEDRQGLIWLERLSDKNPLFFDGRQERYPNIQLPMLGGVRPLATDILPESNGLLWISTALGLIRYDSNRGDTRFVLKRPNVLSCSVLADGYLLVMSEDDGLFIFNKNTGFSRPLRFPTGKGKPIQTPICSALDHDGDLWISTWGDGLFRIPTGSLSLETGLVSVYEQWKKNPANANSLPSNHLQKIAVDAQNTIWVCGSTNGLCRVNKRTRQVRRYMLRQGDPYGLASNYTYAPLVDKQGDVWVTSGYTAPLQRLSVKTGRFNKYGLSSGFTDDYFGNSTLDETGKIWFNQNQVVSCIDPISGQVTTFPQFVGTSPYSTPIAAQPLTGEIYFGCQNNLRRFRPALSQNTTQTPSPLRIVAVSCFDADETQTMRPLPQQHWRTNNLALSYRQNTLELRFALLDYRNTASREYAYALSGVDEKPQWVNIGAKHTVDFAQLKPGTYLFHLKARNTDGVWTTLAAPLRIGIRPPWWQTPWAYSVYGLLAGIGLWFLMKARLREQARKLALQEAVISKQQRDEIALKNAQNELLLKEIHHRVKNNLEIVSSLLELQAAQHNDPAVQDVLRASQNRVQSMGILHQQLYQDRHVALIEMRSYFHRLAETLLDTYNATQRIRIECPMPELALDVDTALSLGLIVNELVSNALKYAFPDQQPGWVRIELNDLGADHLRLVVADNGVGKTTAASLGTGFGTQLVALLTRQLDGELRQDITQGTVRGISVTLDFARTR
ncbi:signal transduction histidine kinase [Fibrella aestuarina BUZ 2]|uniref:histidine kinase n=1 Tax=Fibrella aestuarina BUZ 2 TaxID=1166018 RepID=I0KDK5_9BACT|nr:histidine kinase dimerization/phosphoacceptor domain -containing protein [Fibrella aestuarina]CCH02208.1 signal transduction histidine kinase [Fibrella aestuarina BUZ 2]